MTTTFERSFPLDDIAIRSGGDGRTVEAYAAVFDTPTEIVDVHGRYLEQIDRSAFDRSVQHNGTRFGVFYNHGKTLYGTPSDRGSVPIGSPVEAPRADGRGLRTVTRYNKTELADSVLEAIRNGDITGQSFTGRIIRSSMERPRGGYRPKADGSLHTVTRLELALREYGPTPIPAYDVPMVLSVRSLADRLTDLDDEQRAELARMLGLATPLDPATAGDQGPAQDTATALHSALGAEDSQQRSGRLTPAQRARVGAILRGM